MRVYSEFILIREEPRVFLQCDPRQEDVLLHAAVHTQSLSDDTFLFIRFHFMLLTFYESFDAVDRKSVV